MEYGDYTTITPPSVPSSCYMYEMKLSVLSYADKSSDLIVGEQKTAG